MLDVSTIGDPVVRHTFERAEERALVLQSFPEFMKRAWRLVDGAPLVWGWFLQLLCEELQRWEQREFRNLIIAVPPGAGKSLVASVLLPAWMWLRNPANQFLCCAHSQELAVRDNVRMRDLVRSEWYQWLIDGRWRLKDDQDQKTRYANTVFGQRQGIGGKSGLAGWRGNDVIIDDPLDLNPRKPARPEDLDAAFAWVQYIRAQRVNDPKLARTLLIAQRGYEDDPTGRLLQLEPEDWHCVYFDMELDPTMPHRHPEDPRTDDGELLFPERIGPVEVSLRQRALGPEQYSAQNQQQPIIPGGMIIKEQDIEIIGKPLNKYEHVIISWDLAFKGEETSSFVVGTVWGILAPQNIEHRYFDLLDVWRDRVDYPGSRAAIQSLALRHPEATAIVIEDKASGPAAIAELKSMYPTIVPFNPNPYGDKPSRLRAVSPVFAQGRVRILEAPWNQAWLSELTSAPKCKEWDQVDSTSQALLFAQYELHKCSAGYRPVRLLGGW